MTEFEQMATSGRPSPPVLRWARNWIRTGTVDALIWIVATPVAFALVVGLGVTPAPVLLSALFASLAAKIAAGTVFGLHLHSWRTVGFHDAATVVTAMSTVAVLGTVIALVLGTNQVPLSVPIVDAMVSTFGMLVARGAVRRVGERSDRRPTAHDAKQVVLIE